MTIRFSKKQLRIDFLLGGSYLLLGSLGFLFENPLISYGFSAVGILSLVQYFYKRKEQYLKISNGILFLNIIFQKNKKINLEEVTRVKKLADEITFFAPCTQLKIATTFKKKDYRFWRKSLLPFTWISKRRSCTITF